MKERASGGGKNEKILVKGVTLGKVDDKKWLDFGFDFELDIGMRHELETRRPKMDWQTKRRQTKMSRHVSIEEPKKEKKEAGEGWKCERATLAADSIH
jgi:hypothetical protein